MSNIVAVLIELVSIAVIVAGVALWSVPAALVVAGGFGLKIVETTARRRPATPASDQ